MKQTCEMIDAHHSDCDCQLCQSHQDAECGKPAVASSNTRNRWPWYRVCANCAFRLIADGVDDGIIWDAGRRIQA